MENTGHIRWQSNMHFTSVDYVRAGFLVHNGTDPIVHCVKGDFYPKQEESIPIPIAAEE